ncbi:M48 family metalloprotease [Haladaptatus sp. DFWS20]|uniref:M48 family metalloprotease n=1 Tax=Haladaptatus sp. DFWS20 TaxID=3403467 RepID=UPI003EB93537
MCASLVLLLLTMVATALVSGSVLTILFTILYLFTVLAVPSMQLLLVVLGCSAVVVLALVAWGERHAPDYTVSSLGAMKTEPEEYPELLALVRSVSQQADTPVPTVFIAPTDTPLSLTTGFTPQSARLIVSEGIVEMLADDELKAVIAHELAHIKNRDASVMALSTLPIGATDRVISLFRGHTRGVKYGQPSRASRGDVLLTFGLSVVPPIWFCGYVLWASLARTREFVADKGAVTLTGNPSALASALRKIDEGVANRPTDDLRTVEIAAFAIVESNRTEPASPFPLLGPSLTSTFPTHPSTASRIERL